MLRALMATVKIRDRRIPLATLTSLFVLGAEPLGGEYREPGGDSLCKANYKEHDGSGGANCRQGIGTYETAYDNRVRHIIKLLKDISDHQWNRKLQNHRQRFSFCHIKLHAVDPFFLHKNA